MLPSKLLLLGVLDSSSFLLLYTLILYYISTSLIAIKPFAAGFELT